MASMMRKLLFLLSFFAVAAQLQAAKSERLLSLRQDGREGAEGRLHGPQRPVDGELLRARGQGLCRLSVQTTDGFAFRQPHVEHRSQRRLVRTDQSLELNGFTNSSTWLNKLVDFVRQTRRVCKQVRHEGQNSLP